jgi:hypothetical protein
MACAKLIEILGGFDRAEAARNLAQAELLALNAHLETKVQERTRELRAKNQQMEEELQMGASFRLPSYRKNFRPFPRTSLPRISSMFFPSE